MSLQTVLEKHIMDPKNDSLCYDLAKEYDKIENGAMAVSLYLKAADMSEDTFLQYKCMIGIGRCYDRQRDRGFTVEGAFQDAVALVPDTPQAHYLLAKELCTSLNINHIHVRLGIPYSNKNNANFFFTNIINSLSKNEPVILDSLLDSKDYVHTSDIARGLSALIVMI